MEEQRTQQWEELLLALADEILEENREAFEELAK